MKQHWLQQNKTKKLILYFSGWGMDAAAVEHLERASDDICVVYDYTDLTNLETSEFKIYKSIQLLAWSMGVWVASFILQNSDLNITQAIAINGTPKPVDDVYGIPESVFSGTLESLTSENLSKFDRRMCGSKAVYQQFNNIQRQNEIETLKLELQNIYLSVKANPAPKLRWTKAWIGESDMIFPSQNQQQFWGEVGFELKMPHFPFFEFSKWNDFFI